MEEGGGGGESEKRAQSSDGLCDGAFGTKQLVLEQGGHLKQLRRRRLHRLHRMH